MRQGAEILIQNNTIENRGDGIYVHDYYNNTPKILGNTIKGTQQQSTGINVSSKTKATIENNTIENKPEAMETRRPDVVTPYYLNENRIVLNLSDDEAFARLVENRGLAA